MSDTQRMIEELKGIMQDRPNGYTFKELWNELENVDESLKIAMYNEKGVARVGLLQGIFNRIKAHKISNFYYNNGDKRVYFSKSDTTMLKQLTNQYRSEVTSIVKPMVEQELTIKQAERIERIQNLVVELSNEVGKLPSNFSKPIKK